ncbi:hypothetical protein SCMU_26560 [Sinomonas cyclohexanicum]|uniref:Uncharacterized protein n=1 Tax=Sinomonas cyclohexanicum TaxID=322009 RepID=A0ABM7PWZ6_SINCY|nr:hypothetical protein SCMU_26560 [Corynebacterium cyclohexanicum]
MPEGLDGVGVDGDAVLGGDRGGLADGLHRADLVVRPHERDERHRVRVHGDRGAQRIQARGARGVARDPDGLRALVLLEPLNGVRDRVVLDARAEDAMTPRVLGSARPVQALHGEVVRLGSA